MKKLFLASVVLFSLFSYSFGFLDIYVSDMATKNYVKKPNAVNIGLETKYIDLKGENSLIQSQSNMVAEGIIVALNTSDYSKFGLSFYGGKNKDTTLANANIDFVLKFPALIFLSEIDLIGGVGIGVTALNKNGVQDFYSVIEPKVGVGFNLSKDFAIDFMTSYQYYEMIQNQNLNAKPQAFNQTYSLIFKLSML